MVSTDDMFGFCYCSFVFFNCFYFFKIRQLVNSRSPLVCLCGSKPELKLHSCELTRPHSPIFHTDFNCWKRFVEIDVFLSLGYFEMPIFRINVVFVIKI